MIEVTKHHAAVRQSDYTIKLTEDRMSSLVTILEQTLDHLDLGDREQLLCLDLLDFHATLNK